VAKLIWGRHRRRVTWVGIAGLVLPVTLSGLAQAGSAGAVSSPSGWVAHSAYGIQVSVPKWWKVTYFSPCSQRNTLNIGEASFAAACPNFVDSENWVDVTSTALSQSISSRPVPELYAGKPTKLHGLLILRVTEGPQRLWYVQSAGALISGQGPQSLAVMHTLAPATRHAVPAPSLVTGKDLFEGLTQVPITGPVSLSKAPSHHTTTIQAVDGSWWETLSPGTYYVTGHSGNAPCPTVRFTVPSGLRVTASPIYCQGE
jgi:hypothetical protein